MTRRLVVVSFLAFSSLFFIGAGQDDAWIMLQAGKGVGQAPWFVNPNGALQEVSTSVLGSLLAAFVTRLSTPGSEFMCWKIVAWLPAIFSGLLFHELLTKRCGRLWASFWVIVLCCFPEWHYWAWGGIESGLFWLFLILFVHSLVGYTEKPDATQVLILIAFAVSLPLVRADALWSPLVAGFALARVGGNTNQRRLVFAICPLLLTALFHSIRYSFTGKLFPNPAYAKAPFSLESFQFGVEYLQRFHLETPLHLFLVCAYPLALFGVLRLSRNLIFSRGSPPGYFEWASLVLLLVDATTVVAGGDWMGYHRFAVRTLPLKLIVIAICLPGLRMAGLRDRVAFLALAGLALTGPSSKGVVQRAGVFRHESAIASLGLKDMRFGAELFIRSNIPARRDHEVLLPWITTELRPLVEGKRLNGKLPLKFASYQAGFFAWTLRQYFTPEEVLFVDMAGLSDYRIGKLPGKKTPLGLYEGIRLWAESLGLGQGALGAALVECRPDLIYVLRASDKQRAIMAKGGFNVIYDKSALIDGMRFSALIFQSQVGNDGRCSLLGVG